MTRLDGEDLLSRLIAQNERELQKREAAGDETVLLDRAAGPWSIDRMGPPVSRASDQNKIVECVLHTTGIVRDHTSKHEKLSWLTAPELAERFFADLVDPKGRRWAGFLSAAQTAWDARDLSPDPRWEYDAFSSLQGRRFDPYDMVVRTRAEKASQLTDDALNLAWPSLFASAVVLVFEFDQDHWRFRPPHLWQSHSPVPSKTLVDLRRTNHSGKAAEEQAPISEDAMSMLGIKSSTGIDRGIVSRRPMPHQRDYRFLVSADLPESLKPNARASKMDGKREPAELIKRGRPSMFPDDAEYVQEAMEGMRSGLYSSRHAAAHAIASRMTAAERKNASVPSITRRLSDRIRELEKNERSGEKQ